MSCTTVLPDEPVLRIENVKHTDRIIAKRVPGKTKNQQTNESIKGNARISRCLGVAQKSKTPAEVSLIIIKAHE